MHDVLPVATLRFVVTVLSIGEFELGGFGDGRLWWQARWMMTAWIGWCGLALTVREAHCMDQLEIYVNYLSLIVAISCVPFVAIGLL